MARTLHDQHLASTDLLALGMVSYDAVAAGYPLTLGMAYPFVEGAIILRRRSLYPVPADDYTYCGLARHNELTIASNDSVIQASDQAYEYSCARTLGHGFVSAWSEPLRVEFDVNGALITPAMPTAPRQLVASPIPGGAFDIAWVYNSFAQGEWPKDFQVFEGMDAATVNYTSALTDAVTGQSVVLFEPHRRQYNFTTSGFAAGTPHVFGVRARQASGIAERNLETSVVMIAGATPPATGIINQVRVRRS